MVNTSLLSDPARDTTNPVTTLTGAMVNRAGGGVLSALLSRIGGADAGQQSSASTTLHAERATTTGGSTSSHSRSCHQKGWLEEEEAGQEAQKGWRQPGSSILPRSWPEQAYGTLRDSRLAAEPARDKTELRDYLNSIRSANVARIDPRVDKIWNRVFQEEERAIDLDRSPFTAEILSHLLPTKLKMPSLDLYDGDSDPVDHLDHFRTHLSIQGLEDSAMCRYFPLTLKGDARIWFHHLPSGTVSNFRELTDLFLAQYASSRREEK
ncbi:hypothetical protein Nepgr_000142 [Nepenthes gracilis]|uniref:Retrotransposon gag domain-containing protein n=1 Tax=Nepenthes gracilis TaxID=150966 RepID=A0AAD3P350_NEPGR|nr:hypothetical protein Nepgr_000142 [Nepenthes gracilis]